MTRRTRRCDGAPLRSDRWAQPSQRPEDALQLERMRGSERVSWEQRRVVERAWNAWNAKPSSVHGMLNPEPVEGARQPHLSLSSSFSLCSTSSNPIQLQSDLCFHQARCTDRRRYFRMACVLSCGFSRPLLPTSLPPPTTALSAFHALGNWLVGLREGRHGPVRPLAAMVGPCTPLNPNPN
jgi:hypothetical protein